MKKLLIQGCNKGVARGIELRNNSHLDCLKFRENLKFIS